MQGGVTIYIYIHVYMHSICLDPIQNHSASCLDNQLISMRAMSAGMFAEAQFVLVRFRILKQLLE